MNMTYHRHDIEPERQYKVRDVAKAASCTTDWIRQLCDRYDVKVRVNGRKERIFTESEKDSIVKLRWMHSDFEKCVAYCWKNDVKL